MSEGKNFNLTDFDPKKKLRSEKISLYSLNTFNSMNNLFEA